MMTEPRLEHRDERPYVAIRTRVTLQQLPEVIPQQLGELFAWLGKKGLPAAGAPFLRFLVIDMEALNEIEVGIPVAAALADEGRIHAGVLPAGRYATLIYTGVRNAIPANGALQNWAASKGIAWDTWDAEDGQGWGARFESFLSDPAVEPDPEKWQTEVAYLTRP